MSKPAIGLRRNTTKFSARCIKKRVNLWQRICSISSACLILMLNRTLFTDGSIKTYSCSFRLTVNGISTASGVRCASTSGALCRSTICEPKFCNVNAAVSEARTHSRYGRSVLDYTTPVSVRLHFHDVRKIRTILLESVCGWERNASCGTRCLRLNVSTILLQQVGIR